VATELTSAAAAGLRATRSSGSIDTMAMQGPAVTTVVRHPTQDRAITLVSAEQRDAPPASEAKDELLSFALRIKSRERPARKSYSLFPTPLPPRMNGIEPMI
jgi:hypothetical protein